jgi:hypothetical protein
MKKYISGISALRFIIVFILLMNCKQNIKYANIPSVTEVSDNIEYLDSLITSREVDSIEKVHLTMNDLIGSYKNNIQSARDKLIIDSLTIIGASVKDYLQFCTDIQPDLLTMRQDLKALEEQYRSGKINLSAYISQIMNFDDILIEMSGQVYTMRDNIIYLLHRNRYLSEILNSPSNEVYP